MKIVYILATDSKYEGSSKSFYYMLTSLMKKDIEPIVILPRYGTLAECLIKDKIEFKIMPHYFFVYPPFGNVKDMMLFVPRALKWEYYNFIAIHRLSLYISKISPDIIHTNVGPSHIGFYIAKRLNIVHVWHLREYQLEDFKIYPFPSFHRFMKKIHSNKNYCIAITRGIYDYFKLGNNATIIYNGVLRKTQIQFIEKKMKYFLFAGKLATNKGIQDVINNFIQFCSFNDDYKLYIAGDTNDKTYKNKLYKIIKKSKMENKILFLGMRDDIYDLMAKATALIVPSLYEGFGRITVEAMFNGCLVIGHNTGGTREILESENLGLLYSSDEECVTLMKEVIANGIEFYFPLIKTAQKKAVELYSIEQSVNAVYDFYLEILKNCELKKE
jgi:glycosyltransferase involved in cell wall biosynthesis